MSTYINPLDVLTAGRKLPNGMEWGIRSVHPDLRSSMGFRWPAKGWATCSLPDSKLARGDSCPSIKGDGLCTARTWAGMASGGIPAYTLLLTRHYTSEILGETPDKVRVARIKVVDIVDGLRLIREHGSAADLRGANLHRAELRGANLHRADLRGANLYRADLRGANLSGANMNWAGLSMADLYSADLHGADLRGADLRGANLTGANLRGADLIGAHLRGANLTGANLLDAELYGTAIGYTRDRETNR